MAEQFLNTEVTAESKVTLTLNFSADLDVYVPQDKTGFRKKIFEIDKFKVYDITYVVRTPHHNAELKKISGTVKSIGWATKRPEVINPVIYRTVESHSPINLDDRIEPVSLVIDASSEYKQDVRTINISDIRDFALKDNEIDFNLYQRGDVIDIDLYGGDRYPMFVIKDFYFGDDFQAVMGDYIEPLKEPNEDGSVATVRRLMFKKDDIKFITVIQRVQPYPFDLGDTVEITVAGTDEGTFDVYRGTIMDMITLDQDARYTPASVLGVMLKYTEQIGDVTKSNTRLFKAREIISIMPFTFPRDNPDIVSVTDEGWTAVDDPDDHEDMEIPPEETQTLEGEDEGPEDEGPTEFDVTGPSIIDSGEEF